MIVVRLPRGRFERPVVIRGGVVVVKRAVAAFFVAMLGVLLVATPAEAIVNGEPDGDAHPNVGLLAFDVDAEGETPLLRSVPAW